MASIQFPFTEEFGWEQWRTRYPIWCHGGEQWREQSHENGDWNSPTLPSPQELPERVSRPVSKRASAPRPRVFVSHRQTDVQYAERIAYLADQAGFYFWLDVINLPPPDVIKTMSALSIALRIEMALLNCSHVVATYTDNTGGSTWVPYEYGRVKEPVLSSTKCCTWLYVSKKTYVPEWSELNEKSKGEQQLIDWFDKERKNWEKNYGIQLSTPVGQWTGSTAPLPI